jgi:hypothetical protein
MLMQSFPRYLIALVVSFLLALQLQAQTKPSRKDSITRYVPEHFHRFALNLDNRNSFVGEEGISLLGVKAEYSIHHRWRVGLGYHFMLSPVTIDYTYQNQDYSARLSFWYVSAYLERVLIHRKRFELSVPLTYSLGAAPLISRNTFPGEVSGSHDLLMLSEICLSGYYKIFNWIGPGLSIGYRFMLNHNALINDDFNAPVYAVRVQIFLGPLYHDLFPDGLKKEKEKEEE